MKRLLLLSAFCLLPALASAEPPVSIDKQEANTWVKRSPLPGGPASPRLGYEASYGYDSRVGKILRWGGHDPGGGGPQLSETWAYDLRAGTWELTMPNNNPPGNCCCRENCSDPTTNKWYRFSHPSFGHGWMWDRSRYLREDSVWTFDLAENKWVNMRPGKEPKLNVGKPVVWDPNAGLFWVYDTKLRAYDPHTNTWSVVNESTKVTGGEEGGKGIGKRTYAAMALDPERNKIVLFGDHYQSDPRTLVYDIAKDEWTDMKPKTSPPWDRSCPTMVYDSANKIMICVTLGTRWDVDDWAKKIADDPKSTPEQKAAADAEKSKKRLETWTYDLGSNAWTKMAVQGGPSVVGTRDRLMLYLPDMNIVVLESRGQEQEVWTYRYKAAPPAPAIKPRPRNQPRVLIDSRVDVLAKDKVVYSWAKSADPDVLGYVVERAPLLPVSAAQKVSSAKQYGDNPIPLAAMAEKALIGEWKRLTDKPIAATELTDTVDLSAKIELGKIYWQALFTAKSKGAITTRPEDDKNFDMSKPGCPFTLYCYRVRAVSKAGTESGPSPYQMTVANEVDNLFTKEDGKDVQMKWSPSPHAGIRGYYVYRLDDRYGTVSLLTPEPIKETTFTDKTADGKSRRYYVVVVDALGQQGIPTHEAWGFRQYTNIYSQFYPKDGWHQ